VDLSAFAESLQRGLKELPPIVLALGLLAGPTAALILYRMVAAAARRRQAASAVGAAPLWVCHDCRSVNPLRASRCYRCGLDRDRAGEVEIVVNRPAVRAAPDRVPAGSPFAAAGGRRPGPGTPVMADRDALARRVAVGPGHEQDRVQAEPKPEPAERVEADR
jgi:hypothetical protein